MKSQPSRLGYLAAMLGLSAGIGINPALDAPASRSGYRRPGSGRRRRSHGSTKRMTREAIERQCQKESERLNPLYHRVAVAIEPPPWPGRHPRVLAAVIVVGPVSIHERAGTYFHELLGHYRFEIRWRPVRHSDFTRRALPYLAHDYRQHKLATYWQDRRNAA